MIPLPTIWTKEDNTKHELAWPPDPGVRIAHVELQINTACDLACFGCDRFSDIISDNNMTVEQVDLFVKESFDLDWKWERIRLLGGEPTLHPRFQQMIELLVMYRKRHPDVFLQVLTNGQGKASRYRHWLEELNISLHAEYKERGMQPPWFNNTRLCPVDRYGPDTPPLPPCAIFGIKGCGLGLTRYGYFIDGAGASAARVAGLDVGIQSLKGVTWDAIMEQAKVLCRICGHWNPMSWTNPAVFLDPVTQKVSDTGQVTGEFWTKHIASFNREHPKMTVYGEKA
jgi:hypothetical protein